MLAKPGAMIPILIVDDNPELLRMYNLSLPLVSQNEFRVMTAADGVEGLQIYFASNPHPACVVIDVKMPEIDGYQLVRVLRGDPESADTPLIILTAMAQDYQKYTGLASGADRYLIKPVEPTELLAAIRQAIAADATSREEQMRRMADTEDDTL